MSLYLFICFCFAEYIVKQNLLTTIPRLSTEWSVSFDVTLSAINADWVNLFHFTIGENAKKHGDRTPAVFQPPHKTSLVIALSIGFNNNYQIPTQDLGLNMKHHVEIDQIYVANGVYNLNIKVNGTKVASKINEKAQQFYNAEVWASNRWKVVPSNPPILSNLGFVNFL